MRRRGSRRRWSISTSGPSPKRQSPHIQSLGVAAMAHALQCAAEPMLRLLLLSLLLFAPCCGRPVAVHDPSTLIQPLIDPAKLATLRERGANSRIQKVTAILWQAKVNGRDPATLAEQAVARIKWGGTARFFERESNGAHRLHHAT